MYHARRQIGDRGKKPATKIRWASAVALGSIVCLGSAVHTVAPQVSALFSQGYQRLLGRTSTRAPRHGAAECRRTRSGRRRFERKGRRGKWLCRQFIGNQLFRQRVCWKWVVEQQLVRRCCGRWFVQFLQRRQLRWQWFIKRQFVGWFYRQLIRKFVRQRIVGRQLVRRLCRQRFVGRQFVWQWFVGWQLRWQWIVRRRFVCWR